MTNGDQTDTVYQGLERGMSFEESLRSRKFEPDGPNYTPRISGVMCVENGRFDYAMSILKSNNGNPDACLRYTFSYENPAAGEGHFIHTYMHDGNPLPSFEGEPKLVGISGGIDEFTENLWKCLNEENKVSLFVRSPFVTMVFPPNTLTGAYIIRLGSSNLDASKASVRIPSPSPTKIRFRLLELLPIIKYAVTAFIPSSLLPITIPLPG